MKKFTAILLSLAVLLSFGILPAKGKAEYFKKNGFVYALNGSEAQICFYYGNAESVKYPSKIDGHKVTKIGCDYDADNYGPKPNKKLKAVKIPDSVKELEARCFDGFKKLESVTFGKSLKKISPFCFCECTSLKSIKIPSGIRRICWGAFLDCTKLTKAELPSSLRVIEYCAFCRSGVKCITIPKKVKMLGNTTYDAPGVFEDSKLKEIRVAKSNKTFAATGGVLYNKRQTALCLYPPMKTDKSFKTPKTVTGISPSAFAGNNKLRKITFSKKVKTIHGWAFNNCKNLERITFKTNKLATIGTCAFSGCEKLKKVTLPDSTRRISYCAFMGCSSLTLLTTGKKLGKIGSAAFCNCEKLVNVKLNSQVSLKIQKEAFLGCDNMKTITIPKTIQSIGSNAIGYFHNEYEDNDDPDLITMGRIKGFIIKGKAGSAAQDYAKKNKIKFVKI